LVFQQRLQTRRRILALRLLSLDALFFLLVLVALKVVLFE
jgi:hypothetical protein